MSESDKPMRRSNGNGGDTPQDQERLVRHIPLRKKQPIKPARMQLNLTSMIDVIFQLLIYFVITANFVIDEGVLTATLPAGPGQPPPTDLEPPPQPVVIVLSPVASIGVQISIEGQAHRFEDFTALRRHLEAVQRNPERGRTGPYPPDHPFHLAPRQGLRWQHAVNGLNAAIAAGYSNVQFKQSQE